MLLHMSLVILITFQSASLLQDYYEDNHEALNCDSFMECAGLSYGLNTTACRNKIGYCMLYWAPGLSWNAQNKTSNVHDKQLLRSKLLREVCMEENKGAALSYWADKDINWKCVVQCFTFDSFTFEDIICRNNSYLRINKCLEYCGIQVAVYKLDGEWVYKLGSL